MPRAELVAYRHSAGLVHVEDESNLDPRYARNRLRHGALAQLKVSFPAAVDALGQVARDAQEALQALQELAEADLADVQTADGIEVLRWSQLSTARRSLSLRVWLRRCLGTTPPRSLVQRLLAQVHAGAPPRRWPAPGGHVVGCYRDLLTCRSAHDLTLLATAPGADDVEVIPGVPGVARSRLVALSWRPRRGGEQFQLHARGVPRSLKKCFQAAGVPAWQRGAPLLYAGETLLYVPALGIDARYLQQEGDDLVTLRWAPRQAG